MPLTSSKLKWAWRAQFLSYGLEILGKFILFEDLQMIVKSLLAKSNRKIFGKNRGKLGIHMYQKSLTYLYDQFSIVLSKIIISTSFLCTCAYLYGQFPIVLSKSIISTRFACSCTSCDLSPVAQFKGNAIIIIQSIFTTKRKFNLVV